MNDIIKAVILTVIMTFITGVFGLFSWRMVESISTLKHAIDEMRHQSERTETAYIELREQIIRRPCFINGITKIKREE